MIDATRRMLLKGLLAVGSLGAAVVAGLAPRLALSNWNQAAFESTDLDGARQDLLGGAVPETSDAIVIKAPDIAENGAVVPVTVEAAALANVSSISLFAAGNPNPLVASFVFGPAAVPFVSTRIKMGKSADVIAVVKQGDQLLRNARNVKVTIGGCGG